MKIVDGNLAALANAVSGAGQTHGAEARDRAGQAGSRPADDRVDVSGIAGRLAEAASGDSAERTAKVEALRAAVQAGKYSPDAASTARGLVADGLAGGHEGT